METKAKRSCTWLTDKQEVTASYRDEQATKQINTWHYNSNN